MSDAKQQRTRKHPIRENLDSIAIAVLMAVFMKYFAIEAYQIPTSSMQPTMMGSKEAGVFDRIIVDKSSFLWRDPQRWEIAVFRYPIRLVQNYVKRIVGIGGDRLHIAGGNVYQVAQGKMPGDPGALQALHRPASVAESHWREIFPARIETWDLGDPLGDVLITDGGKWDQIDDRLDAFRVALTGSRRSASLVYAKDGVGGLVNHVSDGYPTWVAKAMRQDGSDGLGREQQVVQDARISFAFTPKRTPDGVAIRLQVRDPGGEATRFGFEIEAGQGRLNARRGSDRAETDPITVDLQGGTTTHLSFTHRDDELIAEVDGAEVARLDVSEFQVLERMGITQFGAERDTTRSAASVEVSVSGGDSIDLTDFRIERDLHYLRDRSPEVIEVPEGHYYMMGDNTQQSVDSRGWTAISIGVDDDYNIVDPKTHPDARVLRGNMRPGPLDADPINDENPVPVLSKQQMMFTDEIGQMLALHGTPATRSSGGYRWDDRDFAFEDGDTTWSPERTAMPFVPREHMLGRPLLTFWPVWPWFRVGVIR